MTIRKNNPDLYMVLGRRNVSVDDFLAEENIQDLFHLNIWLEVAKNSWVISEQFLTEATIYVDSIVKQAKKDKKADKADKEEEEAVETKEEIVEEKPDEEVEATEKKSKRNKGSN
jgi:hypothetical protein